jgi:hypothetical protein
VPGYSLLGSFLEVVAYFDLTSITVEWVVFTLLHILLVLLRGAIGDVVIDYVTAVASKGTLRYPSALGELLHYMGLERNLAPR